MISHFHRHRPAAGGRPHQRSFLEKTPLSTSRQDEILRRTPPWTAADGRTLSSIPDLNRSERAILLLDDADVFLEKRSSDNRIRNSLVAVFLRKLEYCPGILFLTTNRVSEFDDAFLSRIHLPPKYINLNREDRRVVWLSHLKRAGVRIGIEELDSLIRVELNGRLVRQPCSAGAKSRY